MNPPHKPASVIVLEALLIGQNIKLGPHTYSMVPDKDGKLDLCIQFNTDVPPESDESLWIPTETSVGTLIRLAETLTFEQLFILSSQTALTRMGQESVAKRSRR